MPAASRPRRHVLATFGALTLVGTALPLTAGASWAAATASTAPKPVTASCSEASLQKAIKAGGDLVFKSNCTLTLTSTLVFSGSHAVTLDGNGHKVVLNAGGNLRAVSITGGTVTLAHLTIENGRAAGGAGSHGGAGGSGGNGTAGGAGQNAQGGGLTISKAAVVVLNRVSFNDNIAIGGNGGDGGNGGAGGAGNDSDPTGTGASGGTQGGNGAKGGNGGTAEGGAIESAGHLIVIGGSYGGNQATGGNGGNAGKGGDGGVGGDDVTCSSCAAPPGNGGDGGQGANGGGGGDSYGAAIYSTGYLLVDGASFRLDAALGGAPGSGGDGGNGGAAGCIESSSDCTTALVGNGGDGGNGGNGGGAIGGAVSPSITGHGESFVTSPSFNQDSVTGGTIPTDCSTPVEGCFGVGGTTPGNAGTSGEDGISGYGDAVRSPDATIATTTLASVALTTKSLAKGKVGAKYHVVLKATGGIKPYTYKAKSLPKGLACSTTGVISGRPTKLGTKKVSITVTDAQAIPPTSAKVALKLVVK